MKLFTLEDLTYSYGTKQKNVINHMNYTFENGNIYSIVGKSGAGKTTLLSLLSGLTKPTGGSILFEGKDISKINPYEFRSKYVGVIFQSFNLLPHLTAIENVILSMDISGKKILNKKNEALKLLNNVGFDEGMSHRRILKLSGGEQQRVAIARTLSYDPSVILADEPTGNLDGETQNSIMEIFNKLAHDEEKCVIIVTHSPDIATSSDIVFELN
ncbi:MAG: ATP-binding cassette domain-containing protein [Eubacteriales bacterium]